MGGIGKSALAIVLAHRLKDRYPDAQLFLNLRGADLERRPHAAPAEVMQSVIHAFYPEARLPETAEELAPIYCSVLSDAGRVLLVLDNAADAEQIRPLLPSANCLLLVTSRQQFQLPGMAMRDLDCLTAAKSRELLLKLAPRLGSHADSAADLCGRLPLALGVFAGIVTDKRLYPVPELLERLRARRDKLVPVEAAFQVSYELLAEDLRHRWTQLAVFSASFDLCAAAAIWEVPAEAAREAMQGLVNASVVAWNECSTRFRLHDLVREFCDRKLSEIARESCMLRHASHYRQVGADADALFLSGGNGAVRGLELFDRERMHLETAFEWLCPRRELNSASILVGLVNAVVHTSQLRFHPRQRIRWLEAQREAARVAKDRKAEGGSLGNLGNAYFSLGNARKATEFYKQHLAIAREFGDRRSEGGTLGNLGSAYWALGESREAINFYEQHLAIARDTGDRRGEATVLGNLGNAYAALGEPRKAIGFYERDLDISREIGDRCEEGNALGNLGIAHRNLGGALKAIEFHEKQLTIFLEIGDRCGESNALGNLGAAYAELKEPRKAIEFQEQRLTIVRKIGDRRGEGQTLGNLGAAYAALGEPRRATDFYKQALVISREIGDRHAEGDDLGNLGAAYSDLQEALKAIDFFQKALVIYREIGARHGEANALFNLALALEQLGDRTQAIARAEAALDVYTQIESPNAALARAKLAEWREKR